MSYLELLGVNRRFASLVAGVLGLATLVVVAPTWAPVAPTARTKAPASTQVDADPFTAEAPGLRPGQLEMTTVSSRPALVSGPEARTEVRGLDPSDRLVVTRDGVDVSGAFVPVPGKPGVEQGVVTGLVPGANHLVAVAKGHRYGKRTVDLTITDHSLQGPVISGPHQEPFICETAQSGLGPAQGPDCVAPTQVHWYYQDDAGSWHQLADPYAAYPPDTAMTVVDGRLVPVVVRVESIVINRGIARIGVLDDPHARGPHGSFQASEWNHRLLWHFGESCGTGYHQGTSSETEVFGQLSDVGGSNLAGPFLGLSDLLRSGWMVGQSTLTTFGVHCNQVLSAETLMMTKEHIVDEYGLVQHTIGAGASGGAIQQYTIGDQYPGLLDGGTPLLSFPDVVSTAMTVHDCVLFERVFAADPNRWTDAKQVAVTGLATPQVCKDWVDLFGDNLKPNHCPSGVPPGEVYDKETNPGGVRCDLQDDLVNIVGRDPATGYAYRPVGNQGVQYGLVALQKGLITPDDFVTLNREMGGVDIDGNYQAARTTMPDSVAAAAYQKGFVTGRGAITDMPVIDQAIPASDVTPELDIHDQIRPYETRGRLDAANGGHASQSIWNGLPYPSNSITTMEHWLNNLDATQASDPSLTRAQAITQSKPTDAGDQCRIVVAGVPDACDQGVGRHSSPRQQAGGPLAEDNIKCQRVPVSVTTEPASLSTEQITELQQIFPTGVCDWSKPPVGFSAHAITWQQYTTPGVSVTVPYTLARSAPPKHDPGP